jgi:hypothetical protein
MRRRLIGTFVPAVGKRNILDKILHPADGLRSACGGADRRWRAPMPISQMAPVPQLD